MPLSKARQTLGKGRWVVVREMCGIELMIVETAVAGASIVGGEGDYLAPVFLF